MILLEWQNVKIFLQKAMFQVDQKKCLWLRKLKTLCNGHMLLVILTVRKSLDHFIKKNCKKKKTKKQMKNSLELKKI